MKHLIGVVPLVFLTVACGDEASRNRAEDPRRHVEAAGGFSFVPPEDWKIRDIPGMKFKAMIGPSAAGFAPNICTVDELFSGSLDAYVKGNLAALQKASRKFHLAQSDDFKTTAGEQGARLVTESENQGRLLRQTFYFFGKRDTKFVITCSTLAEGGDKLDSVFETSIKTFRFEKK